MARTDTRTSGSILSDAYGALTKVFGGMWSRFGGFGWSRVRIFLPGARFDWERDAGDIWSNSIVALAVAWLGNRFTRPLIRVSKIMRSGEYQPLGRSDLVDLWNRPNPHYGRRTLEKAIGLSLVVDGNAYLYKVRDRLGRVVELWWIPHYRILPTWPADGSTYIDGYRVWLDTAVYHLPPSDILHIRDGIDPRNERLGIAPIKGSLREVCTVNYEGSYTGSLLKNSGVPSVAIVPEADGPGGAAARPSSDAAERIKERFKDLFSGDNAGEPLVMAGRYKVVPVGFSPEAMAIDKLPASAQARVAAATGVAAMSLGLPDPGKTYSNLAEANRTSWGTIVATQELVAEALRWNLLPEFGLDPNGFIVEYDYTHIQELQESLDSLHARTREDFKADLVTKNEARDQIGFEPTPEGDVFFSEAQAASAPEPFPGEEPGATAPPAGSKWWTEKDWRKQPRVPAGSSHGGEWGHAQGGGGHGNGHAGGGGGGGGGASAKPAHEESHATDTMKEPSKATVSAHPASGLDDKQAREHVNKLFGRKVADHELASIVGAPHDATVSIIKAESGEVHMSWRSPDAFGKRSITREADGLHLHNVQLEVHDTGNGLGREIFGKQVEWAQKAGIKSIHADATREPGMNGHYTWPRFGYDGKIPAGVKLPAQFKGAKNVSDLMKTPEGAKAWKEHGATFEAKFDLGKGSHSMNVWNGYLKEKAKSA